ncbi:MAG: DMT family transporter [Chlamydiae bacterium]|nr:DMT family transporter [Chlamydiota bacterium]
MIGVAMMILGLALYPLSDALIKHLMGTYSVPQTTFLRALTRTIPLCLAVFFQGGMRQVFSSKQTGTHIARLGVSLIQTYAFMIAFSLGSLTVVYTFSYTSSLCMVLLGALFLKEVISKEKWIAVILGFIGILTAVRPNIHSFGLIALIVLLGAFCGALNKVLMRKLAKTEHSLAIVIYPNLALMLVTLPFLFSHWQHVSLQDLGLFGLIGLLTAGAQYSIAQALRFAQATLLAPIDYSSFLWVLLLDFVLWNCSPDFFTLLGALFIIGSNLYILYCTKKEKRSTI